jgi:hypothetical protein
MDKEKKEKEIEAIIPNTYKMCIRIIGIPVFSVERIIDEDALYKRMSDRFLKEFEELVIKKVNHG